MSRSAQAVPRILHCHSAADAGGMQSRCIRLIKALGPKLSHAVVVEGEVTPAAPDPFTGRVDVSRPSFPPLRGKPWPGRLKKLAAAMAGYDLLCTYGPGALDAVLAHTLFADAYRLAPLVHHEGPGGERDRSTFFRRIALGRTAALVVSTRELEQVALGSWQQPRSRVRPIPDGIDIAAYAAAPKRDAVPGLVKRRGELWLGTLASPGSAGLLGPLIRTLATLPPEWQLVIGGELPEDVDAVQEAARAGVEDRVHSVALPAHRATLIGLFDLYAAPSAGGGTMEAMAAGLPILAPRGGEAEALVSTANAPLLADGADDTALGAALVPLLDKATRRRVGEANRVKATAEFDQKQMIDRSRALYLNLLGRG